MPYWRAGGVVLTSQGNVHAAQKRLPATEASYRAVLAAHPDKVTTLNNLAWLLAQDN